MEQVESFQVVMQFLVMPMFFLSGAVFPLSNLPAWLLALTRIDPITYAVDPMRRAVFAHLSLSPTEIRLLNPGASWFGWHVPTIVELALVAALGVAMLGVGIWQFSRPE
jgi:ABC-2 type transport system permease protein